MRCDAKERRERWRGSAGLFAPMVIGAAFAQACVVSVPDSPDAAISKQEGAIRGGAIDSEHAAVMALVRLDVLRDGDTSGTCTGTTIAIGRDSGVLLTAAHCVVESQTGADGTTQINALDSSKLGVLSGDDWLVSYDARRIFPVAEVAVHPQYDGTVQSEFDIALVRYLGATLDQPFIPLISPEEAQLEVGSRVTLVGYGDTDGTNSNTERRRVDKVVQELTSAEIRYDQTDGTGTCAGDSGGPVLFTSPNGERLVAITTFGDGVCAAFGVAVRAASAATLAQELADRIPIMPSCQECRLASVAPDQRCAALNADCATSYGECGLFLSCSGVCTDPSCVERCREKYTAGALASDTLGACECEGPCLATCADDPICHGPPSTPTAPGHTAAAGGESSLQCGVTARRPRLGATGMLMLVLALAVSRRRRKR